MKHNLVIKCMVIVTCLVVVMNLLVIEWYQVPSNSMAPTLGNGSVLMVSRKEKYNSLLSRLFQPKINKQDILVFLKPEWSSGKKDASVYVKRCVGLPGDIVEIHHKRYQRNVKPIPGQRDVMYLFPQDTLFSAWTLTDYGPFWVPRKNQSLQMSLRNGILYKKMIESENNKVEIANGKVLINQKQAAFYTFQHDYYFLLGDNFFQSEDSRYWGCVPDVNVLGKVAWHS